MTQLTRLGTGLVILLIFLAAHARLSAADGWKAGAARVKITPEKLMWMSGYGSRNHPAEGKSTELWAKALALEDAQGRRALLITLDLIGLDRQLSQAICTGLEKQHGLKREQVAINCSHTHSGPVVGRNLAAMYHTLDAAQIQLVDEYSLALEKQIVDLAGQALAQLAPARVAWGNGRATFAVNRRANVEAKVPELRAAGLLQGPVDHDLPVLAVRTAEGKLLAITFGYACHATVLPLYDWSGDYPGFAQMELEAAHPDCVALFWAGCAGDQNPLPRRTVELAKHYGQLLAKTVDAVLDAPMQPVAAELTASYAEIPLPLGKLPTREQLAQEALSKDAFVAARAKILLAEVDAGRPLAETYPYPISRWKLGSQVQWFFLGGEVVVDYALRIKAELGGDQTWVAGYSHDVMAYIPSRRVLAEGGYEGGGAMVYYGLPTTWAPELEEAILREVQRQAK